MVEAGPAALRGSRCGTCGTASYPQSDKCVRCGAGAAPVELSGEGTLWTWTVQRFAPKSPPYVPPPGGFEPFALGYVELAEGVRVAVVLDVDCSDENALRRLSIGAAVRIVAGPEHGVPRGVLV